MQTETQSAFTETRDQILDGMRQLATDPTNFDAKADAERMSEIKERYNLDDGDFADVQCLVFAWIIEKCEA